MAPERTLYLNIAFGFTQPGITADTWDDAGWRRTVDAAAACGYTRLAFYLWSSQGFVLTDSTIEVERNRSVRERIQAMIPYAHEQGLTVAYWFTPSNLPPDIMAEHPALQSPSPYPPGYATICPSRDGAIDHCAEVYRQELPWFSEVDAVQLWFYDPGGCWCDVCRTRPEQAAVDQVRRFAPLVRELIPQAELQLSVWPVWANEQEFGVTYRQEMIDELGRWKQTWPEPVRVMDTPAHPQNLLPELGELGFSRAAFYLNTNIETGWFLPQPGLALVDQIRADHAAAAYDEVVTMRIEVETRWVQDAIVAAAFDDPSAPIDEVVSTVSRRWAGDEREATALAEGILAMDRVLQHGAVATTEVLAPLLDPVTGGFSPMPDRIGVLKDCATVIDEMAAEARGGGTRLTAAVSVLDANPRLAPLRSILEARWDQYVSWVAAGTEAEQF